ncbi:MAG: CBS domain-containing protein [Pseudomonadota bacterium]
MIIESIGKIVQDRPVFTIAAEATVQQACEILDRENVDALPVLDGGRLVGFLCERDVICRAIGQHRAAEDTKVSEIMTPNPKTVPMDASVVTGMQAMIRGGFRHLPVMNRDEVVGVLSMRDIPTEYRLMFERYEESRSAVGTLETAVA